MNGSDGGGSSSGGSGVSMGGNGRGHGQGSGAAVNSQGGMLQDPDPETLMSDEFRMYEFKIRRCSRTRAHDWTECPYTHPGEKARRRDPRRFNYSGTACPEFRKGSCPRGDVCEYAHGVFECWLHPSRYRTQMCTDLHRCQRLVCFFAHNEGELRCPHDPTGATHLEAPALQQQQVQVPGGMHHHPLQQPQQSLAQQQQGHAGVGVGVGLGAGYPGDASQAAPGGLHAQLRLAQVKLLSKRAQLWFDAGFEVVVEDLRTREADFLQFDGV